MYRINRALFTNFISKHNLLNSNADGKLVQYISFSTRKSKGKKNAGNEAEEKQSENLQTQQNKLPKISLEYFENILSCNRNEAFKIQKSLKTNSSATTIRSNIELLLEDGISPKIIIKHPWLLGQKDLKLKLNILKSMDPKCIDDFAPLLKLKAGKLFHIERVWEADLEFLDGHPNFKHRIYYFSFYLRVEPIVVSERFTKNLFMLQNNFKHIAKKLEIFMQYHMKPSNILRDLGIFRRSEEAIVRRLDQVSSCSVQNPMPWMIGCLAEKLDRSLEYRLEERAALGKHKDIKGFLAERLKLSEEDVKEMLEKYPRLSKSRVSRIKQILDYLLNETPYTVAHIAQSPRIMYFSLATIQQRIEELKLTNELPPVLDRIAQGEARVKKLKRKEERKTNSTFSDEE